MGRPKGSKNKPKTRTPAEEERIAEVRRQNAAKAREARQEKAHGRLSDAIWPHIAHRVKSGSCTCNLRKGMTLDELRPLGHGCTHPNFVCPTLDAYRRMLQHPQSVLGGKADDDE